MKFARETSPQIDIRIHMAKTPKQDAEHLLGLPCMTPMGLESGRSLTIIDRQFGTEVGLQFHHCDAAFHVTRRKDISLRYH